MQNSAFSALSPIKATGLVMTGIILSLVLPLAVKTLQSARLEALENTKERISLAVKLRNAWQKYGGNKYLGILSSATIVAAVLVFLLELKFYTYRDAVLAGFAWESLVSKLFGKTQNG